LPDAAADKDAGDSPRSCGRGERPIVGAAVDTNRACIGASVTLGCMPEARACDDSEAIVRDRDGVQWWLGDLCIPEGFSALADGEAQKILAYPRCSELGGAGTATASSCGGTGSNGCPAGQCPLQAHRIDETRGCLTKSEPVGCWPVSSSCPPQIVFGRDAQGARWSFPSGCVPQGFTRIEGSEQTQVALLEDCDPRVTPAPACDARGIEDCGSDKRCKVANAIQYDPVRRCRWPGSVQVACVDFSDGCSTLITHASYAGQRMPSFAFNDSCIPPKYVSQPGGESVDGWSICPEAQK
jgi:hypothetical protein